MRAAGAYLLSVGALLLIAYYLLSRLIVYLALGLSCLITGMTVLLLPKEEAERKLADLLHALVIDEYLNLERLLRELHIFARGIYMVLEHGGEREIQVFVPLGGTDVEAPPKLNPGHGSLIVTGGKRPFLALIPPGYTLLSKTLTEDLLASPIESLGSSELEHILSTALVDIIGLCRSVAVSSEGNQLKVHLELGQHRWPLRQLRMLCPRALRCLGSPIAALVASLLAYACNRAIRILDEADLENSLIVRVEILEQA